LALVELFLLHSFLLLLGLLVQWSRHLDEMIGPFDAIGGERGEFTNRIAHGSKFIRGHVGQYVEGFVVVWPAGTKAVFQDFHDDLAVVCSLGGFGDGR
jgi:hypothetical protein